MIKIIILTLLLPVVVQASPTCLQSVDIVERGSRNYSILNTIPASDYNTCQRYADKINELPAIFYLRVRLKELGDSKIYKEEKHDLSDGANYCINCNSSIMKSVYRGSLRDIQNIRYRLEEALEDTYEKYELCD